MSDICAKWCGIEVADAALVHDDGVHPAAGELADEVVQGAAARHHRPVGDRVVEGHDQEPIGVVPEQPGHPQLTR